jgi:hypothetical protein
MSKAELVITAVVVEGRSKSEVARGYAASWPSCPTVDEFLSPTGIARQPFQRLEQPL